MATKAEHADLAVVGGGLKGCITAIRAAQAGLKVVLVEKRQFPGREITACNHTFIGTQGEKRFNRLSPVWLQRLFSMRDNREATAPEGLTKQGLMDALEQHGVQVLYTAEAVGLIRSQSGVTGLVLATPLGLMHLAANKVADATERLNLARTISGKAYAAGDVVVHAVFEMEGIKELGGDFRQVEAKLDLVTGSLKAHSTLRNDTLAIEFAYQDQAEPQFTARSGLENRRVAKSNRVAACLRESLPEFQNASLSFYANDAWLEGDEAAPPAIEGLRCVQPLPWGFSLEDIADSWEEAGRLVQWAKTPSQSLPPGNDHASVLIHGKSLEWKPQKPAPYQDEGMAVQLKLIQPESLLEAIPSFQTDICVAGGGAGGSMAILSAAESGRSVAAIEANTLLGGTHTVGMVTGYYDGYREGMNQRVAEEAQKLALAIGNESNKGGIPHIAYFNQRLQAANILSFTASFACGALKEGNTLKGVIAVNEDGLFLVHSRVTIDATGNGDVAAFANAAYEIGDPQTGMVQSYSVWGSEVLPVNSFLLNRYLNDQGICHPDLYSERLRSIRDGHKDNSPFHISPMVTVRESRRIKGEHELTIRDILDDRLYPDALAVSSTRADSHAFTSSPLARMGGLGAGRQLQIRIPYGCFIPRGIEGLLVAAKAISGERDATSFCRMNADIKNAGYAVGLAAAMAVEQGVGVRGIDLPKLQQKLQELGILPDWAFQAQEKPDLPKLAEAAAKDDEHAFLALLRRPRDQALPVLEDLYRQGDRGLLVLALAWFGSQSGGDELADQLTQALNENRHHSLPMLNTFRGSIRWGRDYGDDFTLVNRLVICAGFSGDSRLAEPLARLIADTEGHGAVNPRIMPYDIRRDDIAKTPFYYRLMNIAFAAAHRADPRLAPALEKLLAREGVTGYAVPLASHERPRFMLAHIEVQLARAAVRCGSSLGRSVLEAYLNDKHSFFREAARRELAAAASVQR